MSSEQAQIPERPESATSWRTALAEVRDDQVVVRGQPLTDLIGKITFPQAVLLLCRGEMPTEGEAAVLDALYVSVLEHGISPSSTVTRYLASCGVPIQVAVAGGILSFGDVHGGAGERFAQILHDALRNAADHFDAASLARDVIANHGQKGERLPGYGHPQHRSGDPRVPRLLAIARLNGVAGRHVELAEQIEVALLEKSPTLKMNIDGVLAAIVMDLGLDWRLVRSFIFAPRAAGLACHALEEWTREPGWRHVPATDVTYDGHEYISPGQAADRPQTTRRR